MPRTIRYYLTKSAKTEGSVDGLQKIIDYLLTFVGEVEVKKESQNSATIIYTDTPLTASLTMGPSPKMSDAVISNQITLVCDSEDNISVNLIKNVTKNLGFRIFNTQTNSYLLEDPNIFDLTTIKIDSKISKVFAEYHLFPLFQYRESLVFFAKDKKGQIHLVNRHILEYLIGNPQKEKFESEFSVVIAKDISRFVALMDRGLIPISFYKYHDGQQKILNLSGFNIDKLQRNILVEQINFQLDAPKQEFTQSSSELIEVKKGESLIKHLSLKNYLAIKIPQDVTFNKKGKSLIPKLTISVFLDS